MNTNTSASRSGIFTPRVLIAFALCSCGVLLGMFSLAATPPVETPRANTSVPPNPANFPSTFGSNANRLPPGVPLAPGAQFSPNGQGDPSSSSPTAGFPGFAGMPSGLDAPPGRKPLRPGTASGANSLGNPGFVNQRPAPLSVQQPASSENMPLASGQASGWSIVDSPNSLIATQTYNAVTAVTCVSASDCWAVGYYDNINTDVVIGVTHTYQTLIERWDGTSWAIVTSPNTSTIQHHFLTGVTCVSASECWAAGYYVNGNTNQTLVERWNGTSWALVTSPNTSAAQNNVLNSVTCVSASDCWAVGYYDSGITSTYQTLIERWDGTSWAIVTSPNSSATQTNFLFAVTCASASDCWAVGYYDSGSVNQTLIERWDGTSWAIVTSPNSSATQTNFLFYVTCASASNCWAVGEYQPFSDSAYQTLIEQWNGISWAIVTSPNSSTTQTNVLLGVTCASASASDCWAVGYYLVGGTGQTLIERWDGTAWVLVPWPNNNTTSATNFLSAVTCASTSKCWAVGYAQNSTGGYQTLIQRWNGSAWTIVNSPNTSAKGNYLRGVTCVSASDCWAVGYYNNGSGSVNQTLIERWDGSSWTIVSSPNTLPVQANVLLGVTCASASNCWAVGEYTSPLAAAPYQTLIERWDGTSWAIVTSPNSNVTQTNVLLGVTCVSAAADCWAVGEYYSGSAYQTLIEQWNGISWAIVSAPNTSATQNNLLNGVTCVSASECWAVGYYYGSGNEQTLIEEWNGTSWTMVSSPSTSGTQSNLLQAVTCASASASDCWAVGYYNAGSANQTLIERWDGTAWAIVSSPNTSATQANLLYGVTCVSTSNCWAVGYYINAGGAAQTLIEGYTASPPIPTSVVSRKTHGAVGDFDIDLPLAGTPGIECRSGGASGDYHVVVTFALPVTFTGATMTSGTGTVSNTSVNGTTEVTVNLTGVSNAQTIAITLFGVSNGTTTGNVVIPMGVLIGDTSANGSVNSSDISQTKAQSGTIPTASTFRTDVTVNGLINSSDISTVKSKSGTALP